MPPIQVTRLVDFAAISDGWHLVSHSIGPNDEICVLFSEQMTWHDWRWCWDIESMPEGLPHHGGRYRLVQVDEFGTNFSFREIGLPATTQPIRHVASLGSDRWLIFLRANEGIPDWEAEGLMIDSSGTIITRRTVGCPYFVQATSDDSLWLGYEGSDERLFGGDPLLGDTDLKLTDGHGRLGFSFNEYIVPAIAAPRMLLVSGLNVVSPRETWVAYDSIDRTSETYWISVLARIEDGEYVEIWPWTVVSDKVPSWSSHPFAVDHGCLLLQGSDIDRWGAPPEHPHRDDDRLYLVSLTSSRSMEIFPVDERGEWIGPFRTEGRGSKLYLETEHSLFMLDAADIPRF